MHNTDVTGFLAALESVGVRSVNAATVVGAGATARSCLAALRSLGARAVTVLARDESRALASLLPIAEPANMQLNWRAMDCSDVPAADLLVNTAPVNLSPEVATRLVDGSRVIFEAVYNFYPSNLDLAAKNAGRVALDGMHLLVYQAVDQLRLMTGRDVDPQQLLDVGHRALAQRSS